MRYIVLITAILGGGLLYLLSQAGSSVSGTDYTLLLGLNIAFASALLLIIAFQLSHLFKQIRARVIGSRLTLRLLGAFALMAITPGVIVYAVSVNF